jgi:hypothetical protein
MRYWSSLFVAIIFSILVVVPANSSAQQLLFYHVEKQKTIVVRPGNTLAISYTGYNGVREYVKLTVTDLTDTAIVFGIKSERLPFFSNLKDGKHINSYKIVNYTDVVAFRRITLGRQVLKTTLRMALIAGTYSLVYETTRNTDMSSGNIFLLSLGLGVAGNTAINLLLPDQVKHNIVDGWKLQYVP